MQFYEHSDHHVPPLQIKRRREKQLGQMGGVQKPNDTAPYIYLVIAQSAMQAVPDRNQEPEGRCPIPEAEPNNATAYLARGTAHLKALDFDSAIADFTKAIESTQTMTPPTPTGVARITKKLSSIARSPT